MIFDGSEALITDCVFKNMRALDGGVLAMSVNSFVDISKTLFSFNKAVMNGVINFAENSGFYIEGCELTEN